MRVSLLPLTVVPLLLTGCAFGPAAAPAVNSGLSVQGRAYGGQQPIVGTHVYLMAANTTAYGGASVSLLNAATTGHSDTVGAYVLTDGSGLFDMGNGTLCTPGQQVYIYAQGGYQGTNSANAAATMMAVLGQCPSTGNFNGTAAAYAWVDEVSTVAAAYALAGFATDPLHIGAPSTTLAQTGLANAFGAAANLASLSGGSALAATPAGNAAAPQTTVNTLADILAACVNTTGAGSTGCSSLFAAVKSAGTTGTSATDTATAAIYIAHNPGTSVSTLYNIALSTPAFSPALTAAPADFTLALKYTGSGLNQPEGIAVDGSGNVWVANYGAAGLTKILASGAFATGSPFTGGGLGIAEAVAIDTLGNVWVPNYATGTLSEFTNAGVAKSGTGGFSGSALANSEPGSIAIDHSGYVWVGNSAANYCMTEWSNAGALLVTVAAASGCNGVYGLAIDNGGNIWPVSDLRSTVTEFYGSSASSPGTLEHAGSSAGGLFSPTGIAIDSSEHLWMANSAKGSNSLSELSSNPLTGISGSSGYHDIGGLSTPYAVAIDGAETAWAANSTGGSVSQIGSNGAAVSPTSTGYGSAVITTPYAIAIDGSGNVWVADQGADAVVELVGAATPVVTPLVAGLSTSYTPGAKP